MRSREWYEDSIQSILCKCLPKLPPSRIRPAYIKDKANNPFGVNHLDAYDSLKDGISAAQNDTDVVYFWLHFDPLDLLTTEVDDKVSAVVPFKLTVTCYGKNSLTNAVQIKVFFRTESVLCDLLNMGAGMTKEPVLTTFPEEINREWWERTDVDISLSIKIDDFCGGEEAALGELGYGTGYSKSTGGIIDVEEVSGESKG